MIVVDLEQHAHERKSFEAAGDAIAHRVADLERRRIKIEFKRTTGATHALHWTFLSCKPHSFVQLFLQVPKHPIAVEHLADRAVRFASLADRRAEFAILQFDAIHRYIDMTDVDRLFIAFPKIIAAVDIVRCMSTLSAEGARGSMD